MPHNETAIPGAGDLSADEPIGQFVFHTALPGAIRSLDDAELRILLIALLQEWRGRAEGAKRGT
jgi:hypothetical protein